MGARLMAIVAEGERGRVYLAPTAEHGGGCAEGEARRGSLSRDRSQNAPAFNCTPLRA